MTIDITRLRELLAVLNDDSAEGQHFDGTRCGQFGEAPPAEVVEAGCEGWEFDGVPF